MYAMIIFVGLVAVVYGVVLSNIISKPLKSCAERLEALADGDIESPVEEVKTQYAANIPAIEEEVKRRKAAELILETAVKVPAKTDAAEEKPAKKPAAKKTTKKAAEKKEAMQKAAKEARDNAVKTAEANVNTLSLTQENKKMLHEKKIISDFETGVWRFSSRCGKIIQQHWNSISFSR